MFPFVYGFRWTAGNVVFLGVFWTVVALVGAAVMLALFRWARNRDALRVQAIRWRAEFAELLRRDRACRHDIDGRLPGRACNNGFDCRGCETHAVLAAGEPRAAGRLYHRGHTWVEPQPDGTVLVGPDDLARAVTGGPDRVELPASGARLCTNGTGWIVRRNGASARVLAPLDGTVVETGGPDRPFYLRVRPDAAAWPHLLAGAEAARWKLREQERLHALLASPQIGVTLPDGGALAPDLVRACPEADWDAVWGAVFLEP